ncbi:MAG TPA: tetratricopeptide repeat protein [Candidatus Xenobia bacterium]|jgi:hypothetical protein
MTPAVAVCYLVWRPLGVDCVKRFLRSYREHPAGCPHELVLILNGFESVGDTDAYLALMEGLPCSLVRTPHPMVDLAAYHHAAGQLAHDYVCFLNSYSEIQQAGWLQMLLTAAEKDDVGVVGVAGSLESASTLQRFFGSETSSAEAQRRIQAYPTFPNPHVRTSVFMLRRLLWLAFDASSSVTKEDTYLNECGQHGLTRFVQERGLIPVVVGRDGVVWQVASWAESGTFRTLGHPNLLIFEKQSRHFDEASPVDQAQLHEISFGTMTGLRDAELSRRFVLYLERLRPDKHPEHLLPMHWQVGAGLEKSIHDVLGQAAERLQTWGVPITVDTVPGDNAVGFLRADDEAFAARVQLGARPGGADEFWQFDGAGQVLSRQAAGSRPLSAVHELHPALCVIEASLRLNQRLALRYRRRGQALLHARAATLEDFVTRFLRYFPDFAESHILAGHWCLQAGDVAQAAIHYQRSIEIDPGYGEATVGLARCSLRTGDRALVHDHLERWVRQKPFDLQARWLLYRIRR